MPDQVEKLAREALSACGATPANAAPVARVRAKQSGVEVDEALIDHIKSLGGIR